MADLDQKFVIMVERKHSKEEIATTIFDALRAKGINVAMKRDDVMMGAGVFIGWTDEFVAISDKSDAKR